MSSRFLGFKSVNLKMSSEYLFSLISDSDTSFSSTRILWSKYLLIMGHFTWKSGSELCKRGRWRECGAGCSSRDKVCYSGFGLVLRQPGEGRVTSVRALFQMTSKRRRIFSLSSIAAYQALSATKTCRVTLLLCLCKIRDIKICHSITFRASWKRKLY